MHRALSKLVNDYNNKSSNWHGLYIKSLIGDVDTPN